MISSKKILIVTYYWPPSGGVGVQRWMNFSIRLKERGWEPVILTPANPQFEIKDHQLSERVKHLETHQIPIWEPFALFHRLTGNRDRKNIQQGLALEKEKKSFTDKVAIWIRGNIFIPDPRVFWVRKASEVALELIEREKIPTLITTGPPHSMHLVGRRIKRKNPNVRWIADFRDPWSKWDLLDKLNASRLSRWIHERLEKSVVMESDLALAASKGMAKVLGNINTLTNGTDRLLTGTTKPNAANFTIGYFGMLNETRNPRHLWYVLDQLCREDETFARKLQVRLGGIVAESVKSELMKFECLSKNMVFLGYLPHDEVFNEYSRCDLLLLLQNQTDNANYILPLKFFEYIAAKRMILCFGERFSDLGDLFRTRDIGEVLAYNEVENIRAFVLDVYENHLTPSDVDIDDLYHQYSMDQVVNRLEELIMSLHGHQ